MDQRYRYVRFFRELGIEDIASVGGKNASLGELYRELTPQGVRIPNGFAITADAYRHLLDSAGAWEALHEALDGLDPDDVADLASRAARARSIVYGAPLPPDLEAEMLAAYRELQAEYGETLSMAIRSSATAEDLPTASFAGQHDTYLNVRGEAEYLDACRRCFASLFTDRAIHYRVDQGFDHFRIALSIGVMKMVRSDLAASGVMFSLDTESGFRDVVFITAAYGLGENVVQGAVDPDEFYVHKPTFEQGHRCVLRRNLGSKKVKMIYTRGRTREPVRNVPTSAEERARFCISDAEVLKLADYAIKVERHYSKQAGHDKPMDMEWAKDGLDGELYLLQARPETVASQRQGAMLEEYRLDGEPGPLLATGRAVGTRIASGRARVIHDLDELQDFQPGEVLVADTTTPDWEPVMKIAAAIVTNRGGRTCHAAIVSRELGIPAVVGSGNATEAIHDGDTVTVSCAEGDVGRVYAGAVPYVVERTDLSHLARPATRIMLNLGNPELAFKTSFLPNDGVGLARMEFIINEYIKVHPLALLHPERVEDPEQRERIARQIRGHANGAEFFVQRLSEGVGTIAAAFWPKPVIVRLSDFKSNEYASLLGGRAFEPEEANPMLGFRGAARYTHPAYAEGFALECAAMKRVREEMGLTNLRLMVPFCRRVEEGRKVLQSLAEHGLKRGEQGLEIYVMCEIPNNVIQIDAFAELFDGFSIGSNDLTQLVLGVDRDSELVAFDYDERDAGVKAMIRMAVEGARRNGRHSGICGQAPSDYPEMAEFLVEIGIDSMSLNPDSLLRTTQHVLEVEARLGRAPRSS
ncbi:phosphoenolpyruvate synthase [Thiohalobacter sp. IOR34]|uniref:phosphoenolpyruvate synthase n=1 Tax=Thiohalobacter sp. IOR34 TaxID=3057176 RepID=UPI0025B06492|nr:phosphoenolpyruvate synthase [Thiohalobacter sp. IOR34]WJW76352.1 phosphoenolpyruvate synthase [Thiohalobacter sp. IOR34]